MSNSRNQSQIGWVTKSQFSSSASCSFLICSDELFPIKPNSIMILSTQETGLTFGPFMQLELINTIGDKGVFQVQMEHKFKIVKVLGRHKIHPKAKAQMNISLCRIISMLTVQPTLKINVFKMEHAFQMGFEKATKCFTSFPQTRKGRRNLLQIKFTNGTFIGRL